MKDGDASMSSEDTEIPEDEVIKIIGAWGITVEGEGKDKRWLIPKTGTTTVIPPAAAQPTTEPKTPKTVEGQTSSGVVTMPKPDTNEAATRQEFGKTHVTRVRIIKGMAIDVDGYPYRTTGDPIASPRGKDGRQYLNCPIEAEKELEG
jgi:hypothetical protein